MKLKLPCILSLALLASCEVGPDYHKPNNDLSTIWPFFENNNTAPKIEVEDKAKTNSDQFFISQKWWENFNDKTLNDLITEAEKNNLDLKAAIARVKQARANALNASATLLPEVDLDGSATREKSREFPTPTPFNDYEIGFDATWEADIFGGNERREEATEFQQQAAEASQNNVLVSLRAEVARNYIEVRNYQNQIRITIDNIKSQENSFQLTQAQYDAGIVSNLDVKQAETIFNTTKARLPVLQTALETAKNNISVLLGQQPGKLEAVLNDQKPVPVADKKFLITTPINTVDNRPDVQSAERQLAAATSLQGASRAAQYPDFSLSAMLGYDHNNLSYGPGLTSTPGSVYTLGISTLLPLIDFGRIRSQIDLSDAEQEESLANYQKTVLSAVAEIETDLATYANEEKTFEYLKTASAASEKAMIFSKARYNSGVSAFTDVLIAQRDLYTAQSQLADSEANVAKDLIALNKALGR